MKSFSNPLFTFSGKNFVAHATILPIKYCFKNVVHDTKALSTSRNRISFLLFELVMREGAVVAIDGSTTLQMGNISLAFVAAIASLASTDQRSDRPHLTPNLFSIPLIITVARPSKMNSLGNSSTWIIGESLEISSPA